MAYDNAALVRRYIDEIWTKGNLNAVDEFCAPDHVSHDPLVGDVKGIDALKAEVQAYRNGFPDLRFHVTDIVVSGEKVALRWTATGTHRGTFLGQPPTGKAQTVDGVTFARVHNGKLVEQWPMWDTLKVANNLGMLSAVGAEAPRVEKAEKREARPH